MMRKPIPVWLPMAAPGALGTNPIAFGFPVENSHPMIVDMATSATAFRQKTLQGNRENIYIGEKGWR